MSDEYEYHAFQVDVVADYWLDGDKLIVDDGVERVEIENGELVWRLVTDLRDRLSLALERMDKVTGRVRSEADELDAIIETFATTTD